MQETVLSHQLVQDSMVICFFLPTRLECCTDRRDVYSGDLLGMPDLRVLGRSPHVVQHLLSCVSLAHFTSKGSCSTPFGFLPWRVVKIALDDPLMQGIDFPKEVRNAEWRCRMDLISSETA